MPSVDSDYRWNRSRAEELTQSEDLRAIIEGDKLPNLTVARLSDVGGPAPLNNQALAWSAAEGKYVPTTFAGAGSGLLQPDETLIVGPAEEASQQFALASIPAVGTLMVAVNGVMQRYPTDYTLSVNLVTFTEFTVAQGDGVWAKYQ